MADSHSKARSRAEAKSLGLSKYFTGKPCPRGHIAERYTGKGSCVECLAITARSGEKKAYDKAYYQKRRKEILLRSKAYHRKNKGRYLENARAWAKRNPLKRKFISMTYRDKRRAQVAGGATSREVHDWAEKQNKSCHWCGGSCARNFHVDHYIPLSKGGKHELENLVIACPSCNFQKSSKDPYEFAAEVGRLF